eukprot:NODE_1680_length_589_cov_1035.814815_g1233_i0.p1 GENE.NODE_1680_length_589_cov_1035.814815_g1233_i0~~NODE_1680_length_589_cov_1035.814815_g1233_i0.p1  ORF type:complete len:143 (+),score=21.24 NODE_1680_length_589_cov_1035.814815_g1233_i0:47-475(+)
MKTQFIDASKTREDAVTFLDYCTMMGYLEHITQDHPFQDNLEFFRVTDKKAKTKTTVHEDSSLRQSMKIDLKRAPSEKSRDQSSIGQLSNRSASNRNRIDGVDSKLESLLGQLKQLQALVEKEEARMTRADMPLVSSIDSYS